MPVSALEDSIEAVQRERMSATAGIGIAMIWLLQDGHEAVVRKMARDMNLFEADFRKADRVERIECNGWALDDLTNAIDDN
jgi:hypothetical protein